jgi:hypothetical protein
VLSVSTGLEFGLILRHTRRCSAGLSLVGVALRGPVPINPLPRLATAALTLELAGLAALIASSFVDLPLVTDRVGQAARVQWGPGAPVPAESTDCGCYLIEVDTPDAYIFQFAGPVMPAGPGPGGGDRVDVAYLETARGWVILSVTTHPGYPDSVTYTTPDYDRYQSRLPFAYAALAGLLVGSVLLVTGAVILVLAVRDARAGAVSAALGIASFLGLAPILGGSLGVGGSGPVFELLSVASLGAVLGAVVAGMVSRSRHEKPARFAGFGLIASICVGVVGSSSGSLSRSEPSAPETRAIGERLRGEAQSVLRHHFPRAKPRLNHFVPACGGTPVVVVR